MLHEASQHILQVEVLLLGLYSCLVATGAKLTSVGDMLNQNIPLNELGQVGDKHLMFLCGQPGGDERLPAKVFYIQVDHASSAHSSWGGLRQVLHLKQYGDLHSQKLY